MLTDRSGSGKQRIIRAATFALLSLSLNCLSPKPSVGINTPTDGQSVEAQKDSSNQLSFSVQGSSSRVSDNPELRVFVLALPNDSNYWSIQEPPAATNPNGSWSGRVKIGTYYDPRKVNYEMKIVAVAADPANMEPMAKALHSVSDPKDLKPVAQSKVIGVVINSTK